MRELFFIFASIGFMSLLFNSFKDFFKQVVDDRWNWFCRGCVLTLYSLSGINASILINTLFSLIIVGILSLQKKITNIGFASGDRDAFLWIYTGYLLFHPFFALLFSIIQILGILLLFVGMKVVKTDFKKIKKISLYPTITFSFFFTNAIGSALGII